MKCLHFNRLWIVVVSTICAALFVTSSAPVAAESAGGSTRPVRELAARIDGGDDHTCVILDGGSVRCWGNGADGRLGYGNTVDIGDDQTPDSVGPIDLGAGRTATSVAAGGEHSCVVLDDGSVRCWGRGVLGQLGYGNTTDIGDDETPGSSGPVDLGAGRTAQAITAGIYHTCAILDNGRVRCWGDGNGGKLGYGNVDWIGDDESPGSVGPVDLGAGRTATAIMAGGDHTCAILDDGRVRCWGYGDYGQLGYGDTERIGDDESPGSVSPVDLGAGRTATAITAGNSHTCAILDDATVRCWGGNSSGQLGYGDTDRIGDDESPGSVGPVDLGVGRTATAIAAGYNFTCAQLDDASVRCWGDGRYGELGNGDIIDIGDDETPGSVDPVDLGTGRTSRAITAGSFHMCVIVDDASLRCWGYGHSGSLGYGNTEDIGDDETPAGLGPVPLGGLVGAPAVESLPPVDATRFVPLVPERILDTRIGLGAPVGKVLADGEISLSVAGHGGVPATGVTAVVLNVTANQAIGPGFVTVSPSGLPRPLASNINVERVDQTIPNLVTVAVGTDGKVNLYSFGGAHLIADVAGYYTPVDEPSRPGRFFAVPPTRLLDTRIAPDDRIGAGTTRELTVVGGPIPTVGTAAVVLNVTAVNSTERGFLTVFPTGSPFPVASNLNYDVGQNIPNQVIVPVGPNGTISMYAEGATHVVVDIAGGFTSAAAPSSITGLFVPVTPMRALDTRPADIVAPGGTVDVPVVATLAPPHGVFVAAVAMNVTAVGSTAAGFVTAYPGGTPLPLASNLNLERRGQTIANHVTVGIRDVNAGGLPSAGTVTLYSLSGTHLVTDLNGYYLQSTDVLL